MAKITISRLFEISKALTTKSGQELSDSLTYLSEFAEVTLRNLRNQLTFTDNMDCENRRVSVRNNTETVVSIAKRKRASRIYVDRVVNDTYYVVDSFGWKFNTAGEIVIKVGFTNSPDANLDIDLDVVIHFG